MLHRLKKLVPDSLKRYYHLLFAHLAAFMYRYPSRSMTVIGVTGTNGKSSTVQLIGQLLMELGETVGWTTTDSFRVGEKLIANDKKMTMLGRTQTHKMLREMVKAGCTYAIVETSSQGVEQFRHIGIDYNMMVFTNLTPEHIEAHGGFENYKNAKLKAFKALVGKKGGVSVVNLNDEHAKDFAEVDVERKVGFLREDKDSFEVDCDVQDMIRATDVRVRKDGTFFKLSGIEVRVPLIGSFSFENALTAMTAVLSLGVHAADVVRAAGRLKPIPGRLEVFKKGGATIIVDYAPEPYSLMALYDVLRLYEPKRIIHVTGSTGGGRDIARRAKIGALAAEHDDIVFVTNEDPYDDDPMEIIDDVAEGALAYGMVDGETLFRVLERKEAIEKAVAMAEDGDVVIVTGKGSEPVMAVAGGKKVPSDDRVFVRGAIDL